MKISVFVSSPTKLNADQTATKDFIIDELARFNLDARTLGVSDYPAKCPLLEVLSIASHCSGGVILGFSQFEADSVTKKKGTSSEEKVSNMRFPTAWNNLEAGILYAIGLPVLIFREEGISGGVFDPGSTDVFVNSMPRLSGNVDSLRDMLLEWQTEVRTHYYAKR
jgi:hypothetical protein